MLCLVWKAKCWKWFDICVWFNRRENEHVKGQCQVSYLEFLSLEQFCHFEEMKMLMMGLKECLLSVEVEWKIVLMLEILNFPF